ncbi:hypothetical protein ABRY23_09070 [Melioribacteraceae bacterium 4301-Me]|uniref:hypothetical protein n=1 Tax=Pyranulibacter aquaticus TaxID=3163344 RepID=UPI003596BD54
MKIKSIFKTFITLIVFSSLLFAGAEIINFTVRSENENVIISWQSISENNLKYYVIERSTFKGNFAEIAIIYPNENKTYEYVDASAYKDADALYIYRLKIVDNDGTVTYSKAVSVSHNVSSVKRTWGSIKALFK